MTAVFVAGVTMEKNANGRRAIGIGENLKWRSPGRPTWRPCCSSSGRGGEQSRPLGPGTARGPVRGVLGDRLVFEISLLNYFLAVGAVLLSSTSPANACRCGP